MNVSFSVNYTLSVDNLHLFVLETEKSEAVVEFLQMNKFLGKEFTKLPVELERGGFGVVKGYELQEAAKDLYRELRQLKLK